MSPRKSAVVSTPVSPVEMPPSPNRVEEPVKAASAASKSTRTRRYTASVYLDSSDATMFYFIVAVGSVIWSVFEFNPVSCAAVDRSANRMLMAAARGLLKDKASLTRLCTFRLDKQDVAPGCLFHVDRFGPVFTALFSGFNAHMPKPKEANVTVQS